MIYNEAFKNEVQQTPFTHISKETNRAILEVMSNEHPAAQLALLVFLVENIHSVLKKKNPSDLTFLQDALGNEGFRNPLNNYFTSQAILQKLGSPVNFKSFRENLFKVVPSLKTAFLPDLKVYSKISQKTMAYLKKNPDLSDDFFKMFNGSNAVVRNTNNDKVLERVSVFCDVFNKLVTAKYGKVPESTKTLQTYEDFKRLSSLELQILKTMYQIVQERKEKLSQDLLVERGFSLGEIEATVRNLVSQNFILRKERSSYGNITFPENVAQYLQDLTRNSAVGADLRVLKSPSESKYEGMGNLLEINGKKISDQSVFWKYSNQAEISEDTPTEENFQTSEEVEEMFLYDVIEKMTQEETEEKVEIKELENLWISGSDTFVENIESISSESTFNDSEFNWYEPSPEMEEELLESTPTTEEFSKDQTLENVALLIARLKTLGISAKVCPKTFIVTT